VLAQDALLADAMGEDVVLDLIRRLAPRGRLIGIAPDLRQGGGSVEGDPAHELRGHVVPWLAAGLPDALVGLPPYLGGARGLRLDDRPKAAREALAPDGVKPDRVEDGAEDVVLALVERPVPDPHRPRPGVAREIITRGLGQVPPAVDAVHDLQRAVVVGLQVGDELHELVGLPVQVQPVEGLEREGRVAYPRVAVVPVALAARRLGEGGGERGHRGARRHVRQALDRERGALDRLAEAVIRDPRPSQPGSPEADRGVEQRVGLVDARGRFKALGP
jgi:hypothetical protein